MLIERPVRVSRLFEWEGAGDVDLEWTTLYQSVEFVDDLAIRLAVISTDLHTGPRFGYGLDAVGMGDASPVAHGRQRPIGGLATGRDECRIHATRGELSSGGGDVIPVTLHDDLGTQSIYQGHTVVAGCDGEDPRTHPFGQLHGHMPDAAAGTEDHYRLTALQPDDDV